MMLSPKADTTFSLNCWREGEDSPVLGLCHPRIAGTVEVHRGSPEDTSPACSGNAGTTKKRSLETYVSDANERTAYQSEDEENDDDASYGMSYIKTESISSPLPLRTSPGIVRLPTARVLHFEEEEGEREENPISETQYHSLLPAW
jgi:hypothetical protein